MIKAENVTFEYDRLDEEGNIESKLTACQSEPEDCVRKFY